MNSKTTVSEKVFHVINNVFLGFNAFIALFPLLYVLASAFSSSRAINSGEVFLWPVEFNVVAFKNLIEDGQLFIAMKNTVIITVVGTILNMLFTTMAAYALSKKRLDGRNFFIMAITFTMIFNAGLIPNFILVKQLGLMNSYWSLWLTGLLSTYNMFVMKSFFEGLPESIEESAAIDGANDIYILIRIILPLSMPIIATLALFYSVGWWNSYYSVLIYIISSSKQSLMVKLYQMIDNASMYMLNSTSSGAGSADQNMITPEGLRAAAIVIATLPIMCVYPFLQKYFVKGVMIGSVKG